MMMMIIIMIKNINIHINDNNNNKDNDKRKQNNAAIHSRCKRKFAHWKESDFCNSALCEQSGNSKAKMKAIESARDQSPSLI